MAAYAATVTRLGKIRGKPGGFDIAAYNVDVTNYNSTLVEISDITADFESYGVKGVIINGASDKGYWGIWVDASKSIKCFKAAATEQDDDTDNGAFDVVVVGYLKG